MSYGFNHFGILTIFWNTSPRLMLSLVYGIPDKSPYKSVTVNPFSFSKQFIESKV